MKSTLLLLSLLVTSTANAATVQNPQGDDALPMAWTANRHALQEIANEENTFSVAHLWNLNRVLARDELNIDLQRTPAGAVVYRDLDGDPSGLALTWAAGHLSADELWDEANQLAEAVEQDDEGAVEAYIGSVSRFDSTQTFVVGMRPDQVRLVSASRGLSASAMGPLAVARVRNEVGGQPGASLVRVFHEPRMPMGLEWGAIVSRGPETWIFVLPSALFPEGYVATEAEYTDLRNELREAYELEMVEATTVQAAPWGKALAYAKAAFPQDGPWTCMACEPAAIAAAEKAGFEFEDLMPVEADSCECYEEYVDGSTAAVDDCDAVECCDWEDGEFPNDPSCVATCSCDCEGTREAIATDPTQIRGVLDLFQQKIPPQGIDAFCPAWISVGCGPVVAAEMMLWYSQRGVSALTDDFVDAGKHSWGSLTRELRQSHYLNGNCAPTQTVTWVTPNNLRDGMMAFAADRGVDMTVTRTKHTAKTAEVAWTTLVDEINAGRPLILGYQHKDGDEVDEATNTMDPSIVNTEGLGGGTWINHFGVVTGYDLGITGNRTIEINTGWSSGPRSYEWEIGYGRVHTFEVVVDDDELGVGWCPYLDEPTYIYLPASGDGDTRGWESIQTSAEGRDSWRVQADLVADSAGDTDCDLIGGDYAVSYTSTWTDTVNCFTPEAEERLTESLEELEKLGPW